MTKYFLYADPHSQSILAEESEKLLLIGGDFGYGNFGDVLQHANSLDFSKKNKRYRTISVFNTEVISSPEFPAWARNNYQTDAIIFVSGVPHVFRDAVPGIDLVQTIRGLSFMWMYGGGFLNSMWGEYVLGVAEYFLERFPGIAYCISGQQITPPFQARVCEHAKRYKPKLLGVRDDASFHSMSETGYQPSFSFDDATEALQVLGGQILRHSNSGVFAHINVSDYTANNVNSHSMTQEIFELKSHLSSDVELTFLQAFRDRRENVRDTREAIKLLETNFPFVDYRFVELSAFCYPGTKVALSRFLSGAFGYSCSYHVALWLQLAGIPCFLRSRNSFYDQKANALGVTQSFNEYLESPRLTDHGSNIERREEWLLRLGNALDHAPAIKSEFKFNWSKEKDQAWLYYFKGTPTLEEKLKWWTTHATDLANENAQLNGRVEALTVQLTEVGDEVHRQRDRAEVAERDLGVVRVKNVELNGRVEALTVQLTEVGDEVHRQRDRAEVAERDLGVVRVKNVELNGRVEALTVQLTEVGDEVHRQRDRAEVAERDLGVVRVKNAELNGRVEALSKELSAILASRSWRLTALLRLLGRLLRGEFSLVIAALRNRFSRTRQ